MYAQIFSIIAPVFICATIGYIWAYRGLAFDTAFISKLVVNIGAPCLIFGTLGKVDLPAENFTTLIVSTLIVLAFSFAIAIVLCYLFKLSMRTYLAPLCFPNTGNMGLPLAFFAFGDEGLAAGIGIFVVISLFHFSIGVALISGQKSWRSAFNSPVVYAGVISFILILTGLELPVWLQNTANLLGNFSIPLMLITLGVSLHKLRIQDFPLSLGLAIARLVIGLTVGLLVAYLLDLEGILRGVVIIQSAMPAAVFNYLLAQRYNRSPESIAGLVVLSTLLSFLLMPFILWLVL